MENSEYLLSKGFKKASNESIEKLFPSNDGIYKSGEVYITLIGKKVIACTLKETTSVGQIWIIACTSNIQRAIKLILKNEFFVFI